MKTRPAAVPSHKDSERLPAMPSHQDSEQLPVMPSRKDSEQLPVMPSHEDSERLLAMPSRQVLRRLPGRVVTFLEAVGTRRDVRALLASGGYGPEDHAEGFRLLAAACAYGAALPPGGDRDAKSRSAFRDLERWTSANFSRYRIAVERLHPGEESPFVGIEAPDQGDALRVVATLLERLKQLEARGGTLSAVADGSPDGSRISGSSLLETLGRRGLDARERERLEQWVTAAQAAPDAVNVPVRECRDTQLLALHRWYTDWAATAKSLTRQRHTWIALGLASRGKRDDAGEE